MSVIRQFATKVAITPERIPPSEELVCASRSIGNHAYWSSEMKVTVCLSFRVSSITMSVGHVNTFSWARALAATGCHVTIGLEQDRHTHLACTGLSSAIAFKTSLILDAAAQCYCVGFFSIVMNGATTLHTQFDEGAEAWQQGFLVICASHARAGRARTHCRHPPPSML